MSTLIFIDFETYWDDNYTLAKMTPIEYILDPRFEVHGCAIQVGINGTAEWFSHSQIFGQLEAIRNKQDVCVVSHNALFDMAILAWRYAFVPAAMLDTLGIARALIGHQLKSLSLSRVAEHLQLGSKGDTVQKTKNLHWQQMSGRLQMEMKEYCKQDTNLCAKIFAKLIPDFPASEIPLMDMVLKACILPQFKLKRSILHKHLDRTLAEKQTMLELASVVDAATLRSNDKFAKLLRGLGVEPPTKISKTTGEVTYAFAKTDSAFIDLADHEDARVQAVVAARLGHKSTLEETRTRRLIAISDLKWPVGTSWMPIPLGYGRAHTHRLGGEMKLNMQNLPRKSPLRRALVAPAGHQVVSIDLSQIEARIVAWLCEQLDLLNDFAMGEDVYSTFASEVFQKEVSRTVNPELRFIGKTAILGLGYNMSWMKFIDSVKAISRSQLGKTVDLAGKDAQNVVRVYRQKYGAIASTWLTLANVGITTLARDGLYVFGPCEFRKQEIKLPNGLKLYYHDLEQVKADVIGGMAWVFTYGGRSKLLYGGMVLENCTQALARIVVMDLATRLLSRIGRFAHQVHDELIYVVKDYNVGPITKILKEEAKVRPLWAPELPLAAEVKVGPSYGEMHS